MFSFIPWVNAAFYNVPDFNPMFISSFLIISHNPIDTKKLVDFGF